MSEVAWRCEQQFAGAALRWSQVRVAAFAGEPRGMYSVGKAGALRISEFFFTAFIEALCDEKPIGSDA